jgi:hypothetical protein
MDRAPISGEESRWEMYLVQETRTMNFHQIDDMRTVVEHCIHVIPAHNKILVIRHGRIIHKRGIRNLRVLKLCSVANFILAFETATQTQLEGKVPPIDIDPECVLVFSGYKSPTRSK